MKIPLFTLLFTPGPVSLERETTCGTHDGVSSSIHKVDNGACSQPAAGRYDSTSDYPVVLRTLRAPPRHKITKHGTVT